MKTLLASTAIIVACATTGSATTLSNLADENTAISSWGLPNTAFYGQTITLGAAASLDNVLFRLDDNGTAVSFDLHVYSWDSGSGTASGANLASASGATSGVDGMADASVATGGIALGAGEWLVGYQATSNGRVQWGGVDDNAGGYAGGGFVFQNNSGNAAQLTSSGFTTTWRVEDTAFEFEFNAVAPVPLPAGLPLMAVGLAALGWASRRKA